jgi:hypothetical protein
MSKHTMIQRLMFLCGIGMLFAVTADFACLEDVCAESSSAAFTSKDQVLAHRIETLDEGLKRSGVRLTEAQQNTIKTTGQLFGVVKLDRPVKHPNGKIEMPKGWLPEIPAGHAWSQKLTPADDAFYSFVEERIIKPRLYDPQNTEHEVAIDAYLRKATSSNPHFVGWTYAGGKTECPKKVLDAQGTFPPDGYVP